MSCLQRNGAKGRSDAVNLLVFGVLFCAELSQSDVFAGVAMVIETIRIRNQAPHLEIN